MQSGRQSLRSNAARFAVGSQDVVDIVQNLRVPETKVGESKNY